MKVLRCIAIVIALFAPSLASADLGTMRVTVLQGDVQIYTDDSDEWFAAAINMPLKEGDRVWVPEGGRLELHIRGGAYIRLDENSSLDVLELEDESLQFYLEEGHLYSNNIREGYAHIQVDTPLASVSIYDNSISMVDVATSGATEVSVIKGYAYAENRNGKTRVAAGTSLYIDQDMDAVLSLLDKPDEWEKWNRLRDGSVLRQYESVRYLPAELHEYAYDFDDYGSWRYVSTYGYVWVPSVAVSVGWAPYRHGKWAWIGGNYVWVSYENWGWAPYHYGRWAFAVHLGWFWVPPRHRAVFWGPGYVSWVYTPTYVAWVPLAPGEIYYGYGYYGPNSVNLITININKTVIRNTYINANVKNAVTVIHKDTFIKGKKTKVDIKHNPFLKERPSIGPPDIKPEMATRAPITKEIRKGKLPPSRVRTFEPKEIKRERRIVRTRESSVFKPEVPSRDMPLRKIDAPSRKIQRRGPQRLTEPRRQPEGQMQPQRQQQQQEPRRGLQPRRQQQPEKEQMQPQRQQQQQEPRRELQPRRQQQPEEEQMQPQRQQQQQEPRREAQPRRRQQPEEEQEQMMQPQRQRQQQEPQRWQQPQWLRQNQLQQPQRQPRQPRATELKEADNAGTRGIARSMKAPSADSTLGLTSKVAPDGRRAAQPAKPAAEGRTKGSAGNIFGNINSAPSAKAGKPAALDESPGFGWPRNFGKRFR